MIKMGMNWTTDQPSSDSLPTLRFIRFVFLSAFSFGQPATSVQTTGQQNADGRTMDYARYSRALKISLVQLPCGEPYTDVSSFLLTLHYFNFTPWLPNRKIGEEIRAYVSTYVYIHI